MKEDSLRLGKEVVNNSKSNKESNIHYKNSNKKEKYMKILDKLYKNSRNKVSTQMILNNSLIVMFLLRLITVSQSNNKNNSMIKY